MRNAFLIPQEIIPLTSISVYPVHASSCKAAASGFCSLAAPFILLTSLQEANELDTPCD
ncbi:UNVERIFIED_CONTAM: hypothetical protein FKN15_071900 [Acipenser sinensis]